jgi:hypothetical protein
MSIKAIVPFHIYFSADGESKTLEFQFDTEPFVFDIGGSTAVLQPNFKATPTAIEVTEACGFVIVNQSYDANTKKLGVTFKDNPPSGTFQLTGIITY